MRLKEATEAAEAKKAVIYNGIVYERIIAAGYKYDTKGAKHPSITLLDKNRNSIECVHPKDVFLMEDVK